ncbi:type IV pilus twitching motility protein PilT [Pseudomonas luteola]
MKPEDLIVDIPSRITCVEELNQILLHMEYHKGSDLFFLGGEHLWMSYFGQKVRITKRRLQDKEVVGILSMIYGDNAESMIGAGERVDTAHEFKVLTGTDEYDNDLYQRYRFRVNAVSCPRRGNRSATITIRSIPTTPKSVQDLGIEQEIIDVFMKTQQGLALVVGATGNGKSTTLAALIMEMLRAKEAHRNLVTIEAPIEFVHDGYEMPSSICTQLEVGKNIKSFSEGVINSMRMAPTSILVGETRDFETASASVEASVTGHFVCSTVHANSVDETFQRLVALYPETMKAQAQIEIVQSIRLIVAQRLIRTVDGGRTAIRSYLILDQQIKNILFEAKNLAATAFKLVNQYGKPMMDDVEERWRSGLISKEVYESQKFDYDLARELYDKTTGQTSTKAPVTTPNCYVSNYSHNINYNFSKGIYQ